MAITVSTNIMVSVGAIQTNPTANGTYTGTPKLTYTPNPAVGQLYTAQRTISGTSETLNFTTGLTDPFGQTVDLAQLQVLNIINNSGTLTLTIGGGSNPILGSDQYTIGPNKAVYIDNVYTLSGSAKNLLVSSSGSSNQYQIIAIGT